MNQDIPLPNIADGGTPNPVEMGEPAMAAGLDPMPNERRDSAEGAQSKTLLAWLNFRVFMRRAIADGRACICAR